MRMANMVYVMRLKHAVIRLRRIDEHGLPSAVVSRPIFTQVKIESPTKQTLSLETESLNMKISDPTSVERKPKILSLKSITKNKHLTNQNSFLCKICNRCFKTFGGLSIHSAAHKRWKKFRDLFPCSSCDRSFNTLSGLQLHIRKSKCNVDLKIPDSEDANQMETDSVTSTPDEQGLDATLITVDEQSTLLLSPTFGEPDTESPSVPTYDRDFVTSNFVGNQKTGTAVFKTNEELVSHGSDHSQTKTLSNSNLPTSTVTWNTVPDNSADVPITISDSESESDGFVFHCKRCDRNFNSYFHLLKHARTRDHKLGIKLNDKPEAHDPPENMTTGTQVPPQPLELKTNQLESNQPSSSNGIISEIVVAAAAEVQKSDVQMSVEMHGGDSSFHAIAKSFGVPLKPVNHLPADPNLNTNNLAISLETEIKSNNDDDSDDDVVIIYEGKTKLSDVSNSKNSDQAMDMVIITEVSASSKLVFPCNFCSRSFTTSRGILTHVRLLHKNSFIQFKQTMPKHECRDCGISFKYNSVLLRHETMHRKSRLEFDTPGSLDDSNVEMVSNIRTPGPEVPSGEELDHHNSRPQIETVVDVLNREIVSNAHTLVPEIPIVFPCDICNRIFATSLAVEEHMASTHKNQDGSSQRGIPEQGLECTDCGKRFKYRLDFRLHEKIAHHKSGLKANTSTSHPHDGPNVGKSTSPLGQIEDHEVPIDDQSCTSTKGEDESNLNTNCTSSSTELPFSCEHCNRRFKSAFGLQVHSRVHKGRRKSDDKHRCPDCGIVFKHKTQLLLHSNDHRVFRLESETNIAKTKDDIISDPMEQESNPVDENQHQEPEPLLSQILQFPCNLCDRSFKTRGGLKIHFGKYHKSKSKSNFHHHQQNTATISKKRRTFPCRICQQPFLYERTLAWHFLRIHGDVPSNSYEANKSQQLPKKTSSKVKKSTSNNVAVAGRPCLFCGKVFPSSSHIELHMLSHTKEKHHQCPICKKAFTYKKSLQRHMVVHHDMANHLDTSFTCQYCKLSFPSMNELITHSKKHTVENVMSSDPVKSDEPLVISNNLQKIEKLEFICKYCDKSFGLKRHLSVHLGSHDQEKNFQCSQCNKKVSMISMRRHMRIHSIREKKKHVNSTDLPTIRVVPEFLSKGKHDSKIRKYKCNICNKLFSSKSTLCNHKGLHSGIKPFFSCNICGKSFRHAGYLKYHMEAHTRNKKHKCEVCQKEFVHQKSYDLHIRLQFHPEKPELPMHDGNGRDEEMPMTIQAVTSVST